MRITARSKSSDPVQEELRETKANWNKSVSAFIDDLINFKKLMNGWPCKFHNERSYIKDPIPADPVTIIGSLAADFQELAQKSNGIINQQIEYSKNRRKKLVVQEGQPVQKTTSFSPALIVEGSNIFTRFLTYLKKPIFEKDQAVVREFRYRISFIKFCTRIQNELKNLEKEIVKSTDESISVSSQKLSVIENYLLSLIESLAQYKANMDAFLQKLPGDETTPTSNEKNNPEDKPKELKKQLPPSGTRRIGDQYDPEEAGDLLAGKVNEIRKAQSLINDFKKAQTKILNFLDSHLKKQFFIIVYNFENPKVSDLEKQELALQIIDLYNKLLFDFNQKQGLNISLFSEFNGKTAGLHNWWGKTRHTLSLFDETSSFRLDVCEFSESCRELLNKIMNSLEKGMDVEFLEESTLEIKENIVSIRSILRSLELTLKGKRLGKPFDPGEESEFLSDLFGNKEKRKLKQLIDAKRMKAIVDIHER